MTSQWRCVLQDDVRRGREVRKKQHAADIEVARIAIDLTASVGLLIYPAVAAARAAAERRRRLRAAAVNGKLEGGQQAAAAPEIVVIAVWPWFLCRSKARMSVCMAGVLCTVCCVRWWVKTGQDKGSLCVSLSWPMMGLAFSVECIKYVLGDLFGSISGPSNHHDGEARGYTLLDWQVSSTRRTHLTIQGTQR